jgi:ABC-type transport system involved in multi-copper enzyme maturation permease subunit
MLGQLAVLMGPIFVKEIIDIARRRRFYLSRTLYGLALLVILVIVLEENRWLWRYSWSINQAARVAMELFEAASIVQFGAVFLFVPLFLCGTIAGEREERTLEMLFSTHLSDREIVLGKLGSRLAAMVCLILCGLPVLSLMMLQGGVPPEALWRVLVATLLGILFVGAHAIYFSVTTASSLEALVRTYWWLGIWLVGVPLLGLAVTELLRGPWRTPPIYVFGPLFFVNPVGPMAVAVDGDGYGLMARVLGPWFFPAGFVLPTAWSVLLLWRAIRRLRQVPAPVLQWVKRLPLVRWLWRFWTRPQAVTRRRARAHRFALLWRVANPLWLRARLAPIYDHTGHIRLIQWAGWAIAVFVILMLAIFEPRELRHEDFSMGFFSVAWCAIGGLVALLAGTSLVGDRRRGFFELVLVTPLTGREIVDGTFLAVWEHLRPIIWLPWAVGLFLCFTSTSPPLGILGSLITATLFGGVLMWHAIACSLVAPTAPAALTATFAFPLVVMGGTGLVLGIFEEHHGPVLWVLCVAAVVAMACWRRRRYGLGMVTCHFMTAYLALTALTTCWTYDGRTQEYPVAAMQPGFLVVAVLDDRPENWFRTRGGGPPLSAPAVLAAYWLALVANMHWARRWLIRHFDTLTERGPPPEPLPHEPVALEPFAFER